MFWFEGRDTAGFHRFLNLELASQVIFSADDLKRPTAMVIIDYKTVTFRDPETLERLNKVLQPPTALEYPAVTTFKTRSGYGPTSKGVVDASSPD